MATLTIVKDDGFVSRDGAGYLGVDCSSLASNIHAVQFNGTDGWEEYNDGTANVVITDIDAYTDVINSYNAVKAEEVAKEQENTDSAAAMFASYQGKRILAYASLGDQLDQQYHDAVDGTTTWKDAVAAVKAAHPKT